MSESLFKMKQHLQGVGGEKLILTVSLNVVFLSPQFIKTTVRTELLILDEEPIFYLAFSICSCTN